MKSPNKLLNLGCGNRIHPDWHNVDLVASAPGVVEHDLSRGLPFEDDSWDAVYHSHVLEHLERSSAEEFVAECFRVLKPGGILRIAVPDLERIARAYLAAFDDAARDRSQHQHEMQLANLEWMRLELLDQMVRGESGGEMKRFANDTQLPNREFIEMRVGAEPFASAAPTEKRKRTITLQRVSRWIAKLRKKAAAWSVRLIGGHEAGLAFREGLFRRSGEIHRWMYDRVSLSVLLTEAGFVDVRVCEATESQIEGFEKYDLDTARGQVRKPDSLFIEGVKPVVSSAKFADAA